MMLLVMQIASLVVAKLKSHFGEYMKLLFIHDHKFPKKNGMYYHSYGFDNEFIKRYLLSFCEIEIIARETDLLNDSLSTELFNKSVKFLTLKSYKELANKDIKESILNKINSSDYVIIRLPSIIGLYLVKYIINSKKPYLIEVVGSAWDSFWNQNIYTKIFALPFSILCKKAINEAKYVIFVTNRYLQEKYPTKGKSISCSNVTLFSVDEDTLINRCQKIENLHSTKKIIIGTCASYSYYKGQQDVIKAISKLKPLGYSIEYQLVGGGDPRYLKSLSIKYDLQDEVKLLGKLGHKEVFNWLDSIDLYIQPSKTEGLPRALIEAMSRGCPSLGSNAGGIPELIDSEYVFRQGNYKEIANKIDKICIEDMTKQAKINYENSKYYLVKDLYDRRNQFLSEFINSTQVQIVNNRIKNEN